MREPAPLLLGDFLRALRQAGHPVGVREHQAVLRLLGAYDGTSLDELGELLTALLGGDDEGARRVRRVFAEQRQRWPQPSTEDTAAPPAPPPPPLHKRGLLLLPLTLVLVATLLGWQRCPSAPPQPESGTVDLAPTVDAFTPPPPTDSGAAPELTCPPPAPSQQLQPWRGLGAGAAVLLLVLGLLYLPHRRLRQRDERRERSQRALARTSGPQDYILTLPGQHQGLRQPLREAVDDLAMTLARLSQSPGRELDQQRALDDLARDGFVTRLPLLPRRSSAALVLLVDQGPETQRHQVRVAALVAELRGRGLSFTEVALHPRGEGVLLSLGALGALREPAALPQLTDAQERGAVVLLSAEGPHILERGQPASWLLRLAQAERRCWLHPSEDPGLFRLPASLPLRAWPLSAAGLREAQVELRGGDPRRPPHMLVPEHSVRAEDLEALLRLLSVDPQADSARLSWLCERHAASIPGEAVIELWRLRGGAPGGRLRLKVAELQELLLRQRADEAQDKAPFQEQAVRRDLLRAYAASEPEDPKSVAHLRWRLAVALQRLHLRGQPGDEALVAEAQRTLEELARSKLWREVAEALSPPSEEERASPLLVLPPELPELAQARLRDLLKQIERDELPLPALPGEELANPVLDGGWQRSAAIDLLEHWAPALLVAGLLAALLDLGLWVTGPAALWWQERPPIEGAYALRVEQGTPGRLRITREVPEAPASIEVWRCAAGDSLPLEKLALESGTVAGVQLPRRSGRAAYQARAQAGRQWYLSNLLMVPGEAAPPPPPPRDMTSDQGDPAPETRELVVQFQVEGQAVAPGTRYRWQAANGQSGRGQAGMPVRVVLGRVVISGSIAGYAPFSEARTLAKSEGIVQWNLPLVAVPRPPQPDLLALPELRQDLRLPPPVPRTTQSFVFVDLDSDLQPGPPELTSEYYLRRARGLSSMIKIPGGRFVRGDSELYNSPPKNVAVAGFALGVTKVMVTAYQACYQAAQLGDPRARGCTKPYTDDEFCTWEKQGKERHPINCIDAAQAEGFCRFLGLRLPSETEWEYAARGGKEQRRYTWGFSDPNADDVQLCWNRRNGTCPVQERPERRGAFGLYDMAGNVYEWTSSPYCGDYGASCGASRRVVRGGSWHDLNAPYARGAYRYDRVPDSHYNVVGFRCAILSP